MLILRKGIVTNTSQLKICSSSGKVFFLSFDRFILEEDVTFSYKKGAFVRLISGINGSDIPGYHINKSYFTVCLEKVKYPQFIGVKKKHLKRV